MTAIKNWQPEARRQIEQVHIGDGGKAVIGNVRARERNREILPPK